MPDGHFTITFGDANYDRRLLKLMVLGLLLLVLALVGLAFVWYVFTLPNVKQGEEIAQADEDVAEQPEDEEEGKASRD